jgi:hypothetical protein
MWQGFVAFGILSITHLIEARLECFVIGMKNPYISDYSYMNHKEHLWSAVLAGAWLCPNILAALYFHSFWLIPAMLINRRIFFDYSLTLLLKWDTKRYTGNDWWKEKFFVPVFGKNGRQIELAVEIVVTIFCIIKTVV